MTTVEGRANAVTLRKKAEAILHESYINSERNEKPNDEMIRFIKLFAPI